LLVHACKVCIPGVSTPVPVRVIVPSAAIASVASGTSPARSIVSVMLVATPVCGSRRITAPAATSTVVSSSWGEAKGGPVPSLAIIASPTIRAISA
jgi:hypothetical protein